MTAAKRTTSTTVARSAPNLAELTAAFRAAYARFFYPALTDRGRGAALDECNRCMRAAAAIPAADRAELSLKREMIATDRRSGQAFAGGDLEASADADEERLSGREWPQPPGKPTVKVSRKRRALLDELREHGAAVCRRAIKHYGRNLTSQLTDDELRDFLAAEMRAIEAAELMEDHLLDVLIAETMATA